MKLYSREDLTGKRFGMLTVIEKLKDRNNFGNIQWKCVCDCGKETITTSRRLTSEVTKSCGCLRIHQISLNALNKRKEMVGKKFNRLTVIKLIENAKCICECECGNIITPLCSSVRIGDTKSCGCLRKDMVSGNAKAKRESLIGKKFGRLIVLELTESDKCGASRCKCVCDCGNKINVLVSSLKNGHTKSCGCLQKDTMKEIFPSFVSDLLGKNFGYLTVAERIDSTPEKTGRWICDCDCGSHIEVVSSYLTSGHTMSCGCLKSKSELKIANILSKYGIYSIKEYSFDDLRSEINIVLRFDFAIFDKGLKCLIEYDGEQHYNQDHFYYCDDVPLHDNKKNNYCKDNNIPLYRIRFDQNLEEELDKILIKENLIKNSVKSA